MAFTFPAAVAYDPASNKPVKNASFQVYATTDTAFLTPLAITDAFGTPLTGNILNSGSQGVFPQFQAANATVVIADSTKTYVWTVVSVSSDAATAAFINTSGSATALAVKSEVTAGATATALNATYAHPVAIAAPGGSSIPTAVAKAIAAGGGDVLVLAGTYALTADLNVPRNVRLLGAGAGITTITGAYTIRITGSAAGWAFVPLEKLTLNGVAVIVGDTAADYGNGLAFRDVEIYGPAIGLTIKNNTWSFRLENCRIHDCATAGVKHAFSGVVNSGSNISYVDTMFFNNGYGWWQDSGAADGSHTSFVNCNNEHNNTSYVLTGVGDAVVEITNGHYELNNSSYIQADSGSIWVTNAWMFDLLNTSSTKIAYFDLSGNAVVRVASGRVQWGTTVNNSLCRIAGTASLIINPSMVGSNTLGTVINSTGINPTTIGSTNGFNLAKGSVTASSQTLDIAPAHGVQAILFGAQPYDASNYELTAHLAIASPGANNTLVLFFNPGTGGGNQAFTLPTTATWAELKTTWTLGRTFTTITFSDGTVQTAVSTWTHAISANRTLEMRVDGTGTAAVTAQNLIAKVV